jgi:hypothetical protein
MITGNSVLFNQATSILRTFGLRETLRRVFYYSALKIFGEELYQKPIIDCIIKHAKGYSTFIDIGQPGVLSQLLFPIYLIVA